MKPSPGWRNESMLHDYLFQIRHVCLLEKDALLQNHFVKGMEMDILIVNVDLPYFT